MPPGVVMATSTGPAACAGVVQVINESVTVQAARFAAVPPKVTEEVPTKFVPLIVTTVPPATGPEFGVIPPFVIVGAGIGVNVKLPGKAADPPVFVTDTSTVLAMCAGVLKVM